ncbi:MAG: 16S rRNA processing protein RimM [Acidobacteriaceae bacterium]|nr:16S rRNA processing protein RimM [Acidobacteriaceae bacterium]MBV9499708.1 16S rRNA processing protein RimM [Acidobacteriaceae bacterium]
MENGRVVVAEILRPRGNRGELLVRSQTDVPSRLRLLKQVNARLRDGSDVALEIAAAWEHKGEWVLKFAGVDSIDAAERFRGADLWVSSANRAKLAEGDFFQSDLIGCRVIDAASGECVGIVEGWQQYGGPPLMEVGAKGREHLIPFVGAKCEVDLVARTIRTDLPQGLLEL